MSLTFEERYIEITYELDKRKGKWDLAIVPWLDARQMILLHVYQKYPQFDENKRINGQPVEFSHWLQSVITRKIYGIWRDHLAKYSRPCLGNPKHGMERCAFNGGGDLCTATKSGKQCGECKLYKDWERSKKRQHDIKQTLPIENHTQEVSNIQSDFTDIEGKKRIIDAKMREKLPKSEWKIYRMLMIENRSEVEAARALGFKNKHCKNGRKPKMFSGYLKILALRHKFVAKAKEIIEQEGLVD